MRSLALLSLVSVSLVTAACSVEVTSGNPNASTCPDASDPEVHYISSEPDACALADISCAAGQSGFNDDCGCGCIGPEPGPEPRPYECPDPADPEVHYISTDPSVCAATDHGCAQGQTRFEDPECGCGCIGPEPTLCPNPNDPAVHYASSSPSECAVIDFACASWQTYFGGDCGCGCIDTACYGLDEEACATSLVCMPQYGGVCDCACPNGEPGCAECPPGCFYYAGCAFAGE